VGVGNPNGETRIVGFYRDFEKAGFPGVEAVKKQCVGQTPFSSDGKPKTDPWQ